MADKSAYLNRFKEIYRQKNNVELSDDTALEYFEELVELVSTITSHVHPKEVVIPTYGK